MKQSPKGMPMRQDAKLGTPSDEKVARITTRDLAQAKEAVNLLLDELRLSNYLFDVEPRTGPWEVRIDCAAGGVWHSLTLTVDMAELTEVIADPAARQKLLRRWRSALGACTESSAER